MVTETSNDGINILKAIEASQKPRATCMTCSSKLHLEVAEFAQSIERVSFLHMIL